MGRDILNTKINLVHRLDKGASGCVLVSKADANNTNELAEALASGEKTYVAIVRGEGIVRGEDLQKRGWFLVDRAMKNASKTKMQDAVSEFKFIGSSSNPRGSIVLARTRTGLVAPTSSAFIYRLVQPYYRRLKARIE